jgi:hypothetical protein
MRTDWFCWRYCHSLNVSMHGFVVASLSKQRSLRDKDTPGDAPGLASACESTKATCRSAAQHNDRSTCPLPAPFARDRSELEPYFKVIDYAACITWRRVAINSTLDNGF